VSELTLLSYLVTAFFVAINTTYLVHLALTIPALRRRMRALAFEDFRNLRESGLAPPISIIVPAYNEGKSIIESVRSLLALDYPALEVVVVNDGSKDDTLESLISEFKLERTPRVYWQRIKSKPVRGIYWGPSRPNLWVVDKENGRKADAANAGINLASAPYVCVIDGDSVVEREAMAAMMHAIVPHSAETVAAGGTIRIVNGCAVSGGVVTSVGTPRTFLGASQVLEYLRAFLFGRVAWGELGSLMIVSGAFGIFRKDVLVEIEGFRHDTVGEDMDLVVRMHRRLRRTGRPYRIAFVPDPVCWTECPESLKSLRGQRERWQRGLGETLDHNNEMLANPRFGRIGLVAMPYFMAFEYLAPILEVAGYVILPVGWRWDWSRPDCSCCSSDRPSDTDYVSRWRRSSWRSFRSTAMACGTCCGWWALRSWRTSGCGSCIAGGAWRRCLPGAAGRRRGKVPRARAFRRLRRPPARRNESALAGAP
jgi:cellulose synthase/poly-beta-1,6-N-acetylglucosamine synthase-like glycosyltransferase